MVIPMVIIVSYSIGGYLWLFYSWILIVILLMTINDYSIHGY
jgi:hypothetical protein